MPGFIKTVDYILKKNIPDNIERLYSRKYKAYDSMNPRDRERWDSDQGFCEYRSLKTFKVPKKLENAYTEWGRFRELFPSKELCNSELILIRDLYCSELDSNDFVSMIYFDNAHRSLSAGVE